MAELSVIWLRVAAVLYSIGLAHAIVVLVRRREGLFRWALAAARIGALLHIVSVIEEGLLTGHFPVTNFYQSMSLCALLIVAGYLVAHARYNLATVSVVLFPMVFVMTLVASMARPVAPWSNPAMRSAWLTTHVVLVLIGYAALLLTTVGAVLYLFQEEELKRKKPRAPYYRLPPLGTLDELIWRSMATGFLFITLGVITGSTWAFIELGTQWIADPRIGASFLTWGICLAMVFLRLAAGWRGSRTAILAITALGGSAVTWVAHSSLRGVLGQ
ncbi:MAG: cytochrome C assembly family protein [Bryobacteraceae bacterium]